MNKILNPNYGITAATNIDMFKGEDMVEIVTDGYGKIYAYPEDIRKIAPFVNKVKNGMKSISLGNFDENGEFVPIMCHLSPYYDQYGKRLGEDMVLYGHPEDNGPVAIKELPKEAQDEINHIRHAKDNNVHFFSFDEEKNESIYQAAYEYKASTQTIRKRLCDYLAIKDIRILMPKEHAKRDLTEDEKNFRWALNKYFYQSKKLSLKQVYKKLIKEKYMDSKGNISENYPQFHKFRYFYYKNRSESNFIISRLGRGEYDRNFRPLLGEGIREFCPAVGYGLLDSTTCDIFLVDRNIY